MRHWLFGDAHVLFTPSHDLGFKYQFRPGSGGSRRDVVILAVAFLVSVGFGSWWIISSKIDSGLALGSESSYTLFSCYHLADVINEYFLLVPLHGVLCTVAWRSERARLGQSPVQICLVAGTIAAFGTSFAIDPDLGCLDWDLLAVYAPPFSMLAAFLIGRNVSFADDPRPLTFFVIASFFHTVPWVVANASTERGGQLVDQMVATDYHHLGDRNSKLGAKLQDLGLTSLATQQYLKAVAGDYSTASLAHYNLGMLKYFSGTEGDALTHFETFLATVSQQTDTRLVESILAFHRNRLSESAALCATFLLDHPEYDKARVFARHLQKQLDSGLHRQLIECALLYAVGRHADAVRACTDLVRASGTDATAMAFSRRLYAKFRSTSLVPYRGHRTIADEE